MKKNKLKMILLIFGIVLLGILAAVLLKQQNGTVPGLPEDTGMSLQAAPPSTPGPGSSGGWELDPAYRLVWEDNFDGPQLDRSSWNVECHEPGWANAELQEYVDSTDNIYLEDGDLVIRAIETEKNGGKYYTSGRVNTQYKHDFKYGRFEARLKAPGGQGFWPAFWLLPTDCSIYGLGWENGEIDIMEILGKEMDTVYGTVIYAEPYRVNQGFYILDEGDFSTDYHIFACEWEPGVIRFYVDGFLYHTVRDWYANSQYYGEADFPAPFNQQFYIILNFAVGGPWGGYPDETTVFGDDSVLRVDYVKVYQKDSYDENVVKPGKGEAMRQPDETGNYVLDADFSETDLYSKRGWQLLTWDAGDAAAQISNDTLHVMINNTGAYEYSVQVVQAGMPMVQGKRYRLSFEAYALSERTIIATVTAPDYNARRYLDNQEVGLMATKQAFSYEFDMLDVDDVNGRVEFHLGKAAVPADVFLANVRLEIIGDVE